MVGHRGFGLRVSGSEVGFGVQGYVSLAADLGLGVQALTSASQPRWNSTKGLKNFDLQPKASFCS